MKRRLKRSGTIFFFFLGGKRKIILTKNSQQIRETLNLAEEIPIEFTPHVDASAKVAAALAATSLEETPAAENTEEKAAEKTEA